MFGAACSRVVVIVGVCVCWLVFVCCFVCVCL